MKVSIWDTYVQRTDGEIMHFDIVVPADLEDPAVVYTFGNAYLAQKGQGGQPLSAHQCKFCHFEPASAEMQANIRERGYGIIEMENCS